MITVTRYHDISAGHRVVGHESKCASLHGHNYRFHFTCTAKNLDEIGRIIDFGEIKKRLCYWLEENWDHRFLVWIEDPWLDDLIKIDTKVCPVPFNPTAENIAEYIVTEIAPHELRETGVELIECIVDETAKCSATCTRHGRAERMLDPPSPEDIKQQILFPKLND